MKRKAQHCFVFVTCKSLVNAIRCFQNVLAVEPNIADPSAWLSDARAKDELKRKLWEVLK